MADKLGILEKAFAEADKQINANNQQTLSKQDNQSFLSQAFIESEAVVEAKIDAPSIQETQPKQMRIEITAPVESKAAEAPKPVPALADSAAFSELRMFHDLGLAGDSEDLFDEINTPQPTLSGMNGHDLTDPNGAFDSRLNQLAMNGVLPAVAEDTVITPMPNAMGNGLMSDGLMGVSGLITHSDALDGPMNNNGFIGNGVFNPQTNVLQTGNIPQPIKGGGMILYNISNDIYIYIYINILYYIIFPFLFKTFEFCILTRS